MNFSGEYLIPADRATVWAGLNDPAILRQCIAGCEALDRDGDDHFTAKVVAKVGPVKASFSGDVTLSDLDPPNGYTISGQGKGGAAGFGKGGAKVRLEAVEGGTKLSYEAEAQVGGKLAQLGARLIEGTAKKYADDFFASFSTLVSAAPVAAEPVAAPEPVPEIETESETGTAPAPVAEPIPAPVPAIASAEPEGSGLSPMVWIAGVVAVILGLIFAFSGD